MDKTTAGNPTAAKDGAAFAGGGGVAVPSGDGVDGVVGLGGEVEVDGGVAVVEGGVAVEEGGVAEVEGGVAVVEGTGAGADD